MIIPEPQNTITGLLYKSAEAKAEKESRRSNGIGISTLGAPCARALWYDFRWASPIARHRENIPRLFELGKREEVQLISELKAAGCEIYDRDPITGQQFRVEAWGGHLSGYLDGVLRGIPEAPKTWHVLETKTSNDKNFNTLIDKGCRAAQPKHFVQCIMGAGLAEPQLSRILYLVENKNTSALYAERIEFDPAVFEQNKAKAESIIFAETPPERAGASEESFLCRWCQHKALCHKLPCGAEPNAQRAMTERHSTSKIELAQVKEDNIPDACPALPEINCRTCAHSTPLPDGSWRCEKHSTILAKYEKPKEAQGPQEQEAACSFHLFIPDLLPWAVVEAYEHGIKYIDINGVEIWNENGGSVSDIPF